MRRQKRGETSDPALHRVDPSLSLAGTAHPGDGPVTALSASVVTLANGREDHLLNMLAGLADGTARPDEIILVCMDGWRPSDALREFGTSVRTVAMDGSRGALPLAAARNAGARAARSEGIVFLDVDCIPGPTLFETYAKGLAHFDGLLMGGVRYLPPGAAADFRRRADRSGIFDRAVDHPARSSPPPSGLAPTDRYEEFWSLSFAIGRAVFLKDLEGFDEGFAGYGGEDTDFAFRARRERVPLAWLGGAPAYHQYHETCDPPLQHLGDIVRNAERFRERWGVWPMEGWLRRFSEMGLVRWTPGGETLSLLRAPTRHELESCKRRATLPG